MDVQDLVILYVETFFVVKNRPAGGVAHVVGCISWHADSRTGVRHVWRDEWPRVHNRIDRGPLLVDTGITIDDLSQWPECYVDIHLNDTDQLHRLELKRRT